MTQKIEQREMYSYSNTACPTCLKLSLFLFYLIGPVTTELLAKDVQLSSVVQLWHSQFRKNKK
jgi:hypothetical protein